MLRALVHSLPPSGCFLDIRRVSRLWLRGLQKDRGNGQGQRDAKKKQRKSRRSVSSSSCSSSSVRRKVTKLDKARTDLARGDTEYQRWQAEKTKSDRDSELRIQGAALGNALSTNFDTTWRRLRPNQ